MRINLPQVGESVTEGTIVKWLKRPGDHVRSYEPLVEIETDKVVMEIPSPVAGTLTQLLAQEDQVVAVGAPICEIEPAVAGNPTGAEHSGISSTVGVLAEGAGVGPTGAKNEESEAPASPAETTGQGLRLSPLVRRLVAEHALTAQELASIKGTGLGGRISKDDVQRYVQDRPRSAMPPVARASVPAAASAPQPSAVPQAPASAPAVPPALSPDEEIIPLSPTRRIIAARLTRASQVPTAWTLVEVNVSSLVALRQRIREDFHLQEGVDLTYLPFIVEAVVDALRHYPMLNSVWGEDKIILKRRVNIGIAAATPGGLVVPVVRDAERLSIAGLARAIHELTSRAQQRKLALQDVQGGTFTVNNTGALGSIISQPLLNGAEAAIVTCEAIVERAVVENGAIAIRPMLNMCLTFDHRITDGAEASAFLQAIKRRLESVSETTSIY